MAAIINAAAPDFTLRDLDGKAYTLSQARGAIVILNFWSAECPWSRRADAVLAYKLVGWARQGVKLWGIASNASEPDYEIRAELQDRRVSYPILLDPGNVVADQYSAITTPHLYVVDAAGSLRYTGALDDATYKEREPRRLYLDEAMTALLLGRDPEPAETPAYGCVIVRALLGGTGAG
ncbi:MAG: redoxin domain-containing protein [Chloroflexi bacterium]|nr:redoxin domain-containing protein [Chloroflexota bacterium]